MRLVALVFCLATASLAQAAQVMPINYDMLNGNTGSYNYWDESYSGAGCLTCDNAPLTGGLGDLTDGIAAPDNWFVVEAPQGPGPYVGWTLEPLITFKFAAPHDFDRVRVHFDDANGAGGVSAPRGVVINGIAYPMTDPIGSAPFWAVFDVNALAPTNTLQITVQRGNLWVFASEVEFYTAGNEVPEPATLLLVGLGLSAIARRRRRE